MSSGDIWQIVVAIVISVGGSGMIILGVSAWIGKYLSDRFLLRASAKYTKELEDIRNRYTAELEQLRAEFAERRDLYSSVMDMLSSGYSAAHQRIVVAHEVLWKRLLEIREFASSYLFFYWLVRPHEYDSILRRGDVIPRTTEDDFNHQARNLSQELEAHRPFLGEKLWLLYQVYHTFALREVFKVVKGVAKGKLYEWDKNLDGHDDIATMRLLRSVFAESELKNVMDTTEIGVPQRIMALIELQILVEMNRWLFGKQLVEMGIEERQRVEIALHDARPVAQS